MTCYENIIINTSAILRSPRSYSARSWSLPWSLGCWSILSSCALGLPFPCGSVPIRWSNLFGWSLLTSNDALLFTASSSISTNPSTRLPTCDSCPWASQWMTDRFQPAPSSFTSCTRAVKSFATFSATHRRSSPLRSFCSARFSANLLWPLVALATARLYRIITPIFSLPYFLGWSFPVSL